MDNTLTRTDITGKVVHERKAWSFSALDKFTKCPRKYFYYDVVRTVQEPENPNMKEGFRVHKAMSDFISLGKPLPADMERYADWVTTMLTRQPGEKVFTEHKMGMTFDLRPCEFFSRKEKVWLRTVADLLVINGSHALSVDWKTGKEPDDRYETLPPNFQLRLVALCVFLHFPQVQMVESKYVYLVAGTSTSFEMPRADLREFIPQMYETAGGLQKASRMNEWPPHPGGLCKRHCAVTQCQYHGIGSYGG
jgi:hypothetical protein